VTEPDYTVDEFVLARILAGSVRLNSREVLSEEEWDEFLVGTRVLYLNRAKFILSEMRARRMLCQS
jgi:hypothetical protein